MRAVVQRVSKAGVTVDGVERSTIERGLLVYLGVDRDDTESDIDYLVDKVRHLRIFMDAEGKMNLDVGQSGGSVLIVSAFTVSADARRGRRPSFDSAAAPEQALALYEQFCNVMVQTGLVVQRGFFREHMMVSSVNDGPICILLESRRLF